MYFSTDSPEKQYVNILMELKRSALKAQKPSCSHLEVKDFTLLIECVIPSDDILATLEPVEVNRTVKVSGGMNLRQFQDRVLTPAMGWVRNYHGYLFYDPKDGR